jgi:hypothetical protein
MLNSVICVNCNNFYDKYNLRFHVKSHGYQNLSDYKKFHNIYIYQKKSKVCEYCNREFVPIKKKQTLREWCIAFNLSYNTIHSRYRQGWVVPKLFSSIKRKKIEIGEFFRDLS